MTDISLQLGGRRYRARLLEHRAPVSVDLLKAALPLAVHLLQEEWSGAFLRSVERVIPLGAGCSDRSEPYQAAGRLYLEPISGSLAVCYGQGRLQEAATLLPAIPVADIMGDLTEFADACRSVQFTGVTELRAGPVREDAAADPPAETLRTRIRMRLAGAEAIADLLEAERPGLCAAFAAKLPLTGVATNTHSSGPLVRFWNEAGGAQGETPLQLAAEEGATGQSVLYPGYVYYLPKPGVSGIRVPFREPTIMRSAVTGGGLELIPLARMRGDWDGFREAAGRLRWEGALPMEFTLLP